VRDTESSVITVPRQPEAPDRSIWANYCARSTHRIRRSLSRRLVRRCSAKSPYQPRRVAAPGRCARPNCGPWAVPSGESRGHRSSGPTRRYHCSPSPSRSPCQKTVRGPYSHWKTSDSSSDMDVFCSGSIPIVRRSSSLGDSPAP